MKRILGEVIGYSAGIRLRMSRGLSVVSNGKLQYLLCFCLFLGFPFSPLIVRASTLKYVLELVSPVERQ